MTKPLANKVAIVVGAGKPRGIGRATALELAKQGAHVVVTDLARQRPELEIRHPAATLKPGDDFAQLQALADEIETEGVRSLALAVDVRERSEISTCVEKTCDQFGGIDILFYNAGTAIGVGPFLDMTDGAWEISHQVNLKGMADFCQAVIPAMIERGDGAIIVTSSVGGLRADPGFGPYNVTKFGMIGLTKMLAAEFGRYNIRCNAVCPGTVDTDMLDYYLQTVAADEGLTMDEVRGQFETAVVLERIARPEEIATVVAFLAGPGASYITGVALPVTGGFGYEFGL